MTRIDRELFGLDDVLCAGVALEYGISDHKPFALPGDSPVWGRDRPIDIQHLRLEFEFDLRRKQLRGIATTTFRPRNDGLREVVFDAIELHIESVSDRTGRPLPFTTGDGKLCIDLGRGRSSRRSITTVVRYSCQPRRGLYFNRPERSYPERPTQIWTQGQAEDSRYYFPCFDYPGEKFSSELIATVPTGWFALSNGHLANVSQNGRRRTFHWVQEGSIPAYLITLVAGELEIVEDEVDGIPIQYYGPSGSTEDLKRAFGRTPDMVSFFSERIGVSYPWEKYATVAVAEFIFGGMENTSATTMTDVLLHDERAHPDIQELSDSITAHELAHQWFGDLLTCREWSHGWLNESFATYFDSLFVEHSRGWDAFRHDLYEKANIYFQEDSSRYRRPLVENVYVQPIDIFDRHLYERGALVLDMIRYNLGDDLWWKAIHHYTQKHSHGDVLTHDFQRSIEEATGRNLDWFFDQWVWKGGHPEFTVNYSWDAKTRSATVKVTQTQIDDGHLTSVYRTPLDIAFMTKRGLQEFSVEVTDKEHSFVFRLDSDPSFTSIDSANRVLKSLNFQPGEAMLKAQLAEDPQAMGRITAAKGLARLGSPKAIKALSIRLADGNEEEFVRAAVAQSLGGTKSESARDALIAEADVESSKVRRAIATALGNFQDSESARTLQGYLSGRSRYGSGDESYYVQSAAAIALGKTLQPSAYRTLRRILGRPAHNDTITAAALTGLGALRDQRAIHTLVEYTEWGRHQNARRAAVEALGVLAPLAEKSEQIRVRERLEQLLDDRSLRVQLSAVGALVSLRDGQALPALNALSARALDGRLQRSARIAMRTISEGADKGAEVTKLNDEMEKLQQQNQQLKDRLTKVEETVNGAQGPDNALSGRGKQ